MLRELRLHNLLLLLLFFNRIDVLLDSVLYLILSRFGFLSPNDLVIVVLLLLHLLLIILLAAEVFNNHLLALYALEAFFLLLRHVALKKLLREWELLWVFLVFLLQVL